MQSILTLSDQPCLHPGEAKRWADTNRTPQDFWGKANSYTCPRGKEPGTAWVLMERSKLNELSKNEFHTLKWVTVDWGTIEIKKLAIVDTFCMNLAEAGDENAAHLVKLEDVRGTFRRSAVNRQYNIRRPAPSAVSGIGLYYADSLNIGALYTWQTMLSELWALLPSGGASPNLPYTPAEEPEDWRFLGMSAWDAIHEVLDKLGCTTVFDPTTGSFTIVQLGEEQEDLAFRFALENRGLKYDYDNVRDYHLGNAPATIRVHFHRKEEYHGVEKDTPDTDNWEMSPVDTKDYTTGIEGATGTLVVWDDMPALYDDSGTNSNGSDLQDRADEIGEKIAADYSVTQQPLRRHYIGIISRILPGSEVSKMRWRDYGDATGLITEVHQERRTYERLHTREGIRHPNYPRTDQTVQVDDGSSPTGTTLSPNSDNVFPGAVIRFTSSGYDTLEDCWIRPSDLEGASESNVADLKQKDRFAGARLYGNLDSGGDIRPLYLVRKGATSTGTSSHSITGDGPSGPLLISSGDTIDFDASDQVFATEANGTKGDRGIVTVVETGTPTTTKHVRHAVDKSVLQQIELTGEFDTTHSPILVKDGTRNSISFDCSSGDLPPIQMAESGANTGVIVVTPRNPFFTVSDDDPAGVNSEDLEYQDTLELKSASGYFEVSRLGATTTAELKDAWLPVGAIVMSYLAPILDATKYYMDRGGSADTDWALMDGTSNATGSGIKLCSTDNTPTFMVKGDSSNGSPTDSGDTAYGRPAYLPTADDDITISIDDHDDHAHTFNTDTCHADVAGTETHYDFTSNPATPIVTSGVKNTSGGTASADVRGHNLNLVDNDATAGKFNVAPPIKKVWFFERLTVASPT